MGLELVLALGGGQGRVARLDWLTLFPMSNDPKAGASVAVRLTLVVLAVGCVGLGVWSAQLWQKLVATQAQIAELKTQARQAAMADALQAQNESLRARVAELEAARQQQAAIAAAETRPATEPAKPADRTAALGSLVSQMMNTPAMRERMLQTQNRAIEIRFGELMNQLGLSPQDRARFVELLAQKQMNAMEIGVKALNGNQSGDERAAVAASLREANAAVDTQIRDFFGGDTANYAAYQDYLVQQPVRAQVTAFGTSLATAGVPLNSEQSSALSDVVAEARRNSSAAREFSDPMNGSSTAAMDGPAVEAAFHAEEQMQNQIAERAATFLSPDQLAALRKTQAARLNQTKAGIDIARQMMGGASGK